MTLWAWLGYGALSAVFGQTPDYHLQLFGPAQGIKPGTIREISRDARGYVWVLQSRTAGRFDGRSVTEYPFETYVNSLFCDASGEIWVNTSQKVYRFEGNLRGFVEVAMASSDSTNRLGRFFQLPGRPVGLASRQGFLQWNASEARFEPVSFGNPYPEVTDPGLTRSFGNTLFYGSGNTIVAFNTRTGEPVSLPDSSSFRVYPFSENQALMSSWDHACFYFDFLNGKRSRITPPAFLPEAEGFAIRDMRRTGKGKWFALSWHGPLEFDSASRAFSPVRIHLNGRLLRLRDFANQLHFDSDGYLWMAGVEGLGRIPVGREGMGLMRLGELTKDQFGPVNVVRRMVFDHRGWMWMATGHGLAAWNPETGEQRFVPPVMGAKDRLAFPSIRGLVFDGKYLILGPTNFGAWLMDPVTQRFQRPAYEPGAAGERVRKAAEIDFFDEISTLTNGDHLFLGRDHLYLMDGKTYQLRMVDLPLGNENTNFAFPLRKGGALISTLKGLYYVPPSFNSQTKVVLPGKDQQITAGYLSAGGTLLCATTEALYRVMQKGDVFHTEVLSREFTRKVVNTLFEDNLGRIWVLSEEGIFVFEPGNGKIRRFDHSDNVSSYGFSSNSVYRGPDGRVYFGGLNGVNYLVPERFGRADSSIQVWLKSAQVTGGPYLDTESGSMIELGPDQNALRIEFEAPYFHQSGNVRYRYQLSGRNQNWQNLGTNPELSLTEIPPGDYTLRFAASVNGIDWFEGSQALRFRIRPPFWQTWWFYSLVAGLAALYVWAILRQRERALKEKEEELETEQAINYFATSMYERPSVEEILWDVARNCIGRLNFEDCVIYLLDEKRQVLVQSAAYGPKEGPGARIISPIEIPVGRGIVGSVARTGVAEIVHDTSKDPRYVVDDAERLSEITVPMVFEGKVLGIIDCEHTQKGFFQPRHLSILNTIASLCAHKIVRARAEAERQAAERSLSETRQRVAEAEMQALRAQMNPHFIFNSLNSINRYIVKSDQVTASLYLAKFAKLMRMILDHSYSKTVALSADLDALKLYIEMELLRFEQKFSYDITVQKDVPLDSLEVPPLLIQPYVENAIWHGLLHQPEGGKLEVRVSCPEDGMLLVEIEDNGIGRARSAELKSKSAATRKSLGTRLTENRLELLTKQAQLHASATTIDKTNPQGEPAGTLVRILIPV